MKYATFGLDGICNGRHDSNINTVIPEGAVSVTDDLFYFSISQASNGYLELVDGAVMWTVPPPPPLPTPEELFQAIVKQFDSAVETHLHDEAVASGYTNIERACMYAAAPNTYQTESQSFVQWVGNVWGHCYNELENVQLGTRPMPTIEEILSELPIRPPIAP